MTLLIYQSFFQINYWCTTLLIYQSLYLSIYPSIYTLQAMELVFVFQPKISFTYIKKWFIILRHFY